MILSTEHLSEKNADLLKEFDLKNGSEQRDEVSGAEIILSWPVTLRRIIQYVGPDLRAIQTYSAGVDDVPYEQIPESVKIFSNAGGYSEAVSEHALALILALSKNVNRKDSASSYCLAGKTLLILGGGGIGSTASKMAREGFGFRTIGVSRTFKHPENFDETLPVDRFTEALVSADVLLCAAPLNKFTRGLITYDVLRKTKRNVIIANIARAEVIDEEDIYRLLTENPDARFGTDVFWRVDSRENFESKLWELPNFAGTLHRAGATANSEAREKAIERAVTNVRNYLRTGEGENLVKREDYV